MAKKITKRKRRVLKKKEYPLHRVPVLLSKAVFSLGVLMFAFSLLGFSISSISSAAADPFLPEAGKGIGITAEKTPGAIAGQIIQVFLGFLGIVFLVIVIYAGFLWMTASGEEAKVKKARDMLINGVIGLAIVIAAQVVTAWVLSMLVEKITSG